MSKSLPSRVERLEQARGLPADEIAELHRLEREHELEFPGLPEVIDNFTNEQAERYLAYHASAAAERTAELRARLRSPSQVAADEAAGAEIDAMSPAELAAWFAKRYDQMEPAPCQP